MKKLIFQLPISATAIALMISCFNTNTQTPNIEQITPTNTVSKLQESEPEPVNTVDDLHRDINSDGVVDSIFVDRDGGSLSGGTYLRIVNGKTNREYRADNDDYNGAIIGVCAFDASNKAFASIAREQLLPEEQRQKLEPVAEWVVNSLKDRRKTTSSRLFKFISKPKLEWMDGLDIPKTYCVNVDQQTARSIIKSRRGRSDDYDGRITFDINRSSNVWLVVHTDYRFAEELNVVHDADSVKVHANNHCVAIEKDGKFAWVFVNDCFWSGSGTRSGIKSLVFKDSIIWLQFENFEGFMIDINTGKIANFLPVGSDDAGDENLISIFRKL